MEELDPRRPWTREDVEIALQEAVSTLRKLPPPEHVRIGRLHVAWPDIPIDREAWILGYGYNQLEAPRLKATLGEITRLDRTSDWMLRWLHPEAAKTHKLPPDAAAICWYRAIGMPWRIVVKIRRRKFGVRGRGKKGGKSPIPGGNSHVSLRRIHEDALDVLRDELNRAKVPIPDYDDSRVILDPIQE